MERQDAEIGTEQARRCLPCHVRLVNQYRGVFLPGLEEAFGLALAISVWTLLTWQATRWRKRIDWGKKVAPVVQESSKRKRKRKQAGASPMLAFAPGQDAEQSDCGILRCQTGAQWTAKQDLRRRPGDRHKPGNRGGAKEPATDPETRRVRPSSHSGRHKRGTRAGSWAACKAAAASTLAKATADAENQLAWERARRVTIVRIALARRLRDFRATVRALCEGNAITTQVAQTLLAALTLKP